MTHSFKPSGELRFQKFRIVLKEDNDERLEGNSRVRVRLVTKSK